MSIISDKIRSYVNDHDVSDHYGEWGILRRDQRRLIRKLCDTCDGFEKAADYFAGKAREEEQRYIPLDNDDAFVRVFEYYKKTVAREIFEEIEKHMDEDDGLSVFMTRTEFFELKKKYTEQCTDCKHFVGCECFDGKTCDEYVEEKE